MALHARLAGDAMQASIIRRRRRRERSASMARGSPVGRAGSTGKRHQEHDQSSDPRMLLRPARDVQTPARGILALKRALGDRPRSEQERAVLVIERRCGQVTKEGARGTTRRPVRATRGATISSGTAGGSGSFSTVVGVGCGVAWLSATVRQQGRTGRTRRCCRRRARSTAGRSRCRCSRPTPPRERRPAARGAPAAVSQHERGDRVASRGQCNAPGARKPGRSRLCVTLRAARAY